MTPDVDWQERHKNTTDERHTPVRLARQLKRAVGGFDLDPCAGCEPESIAANRYLEADDGLSNPWFGQVFVNPPHSSIADWMDKVTSEMARDDGPVLIIALVPARPSTDWWHDHATDAEWLGLFDGRLQFGGTDGTAPFPSALLAYARDEVPEDLTALMAARGAVYSLADVSTGGSAKTTLDDLLGSGDTTPPWVDDVALPAFGAGDRLRIRFDTGLGFPSGVPDTHTAEVLSIREEAHHYKILCVSPDGPADATADETYIALTQRRHDPRDVSAVVCERGSGRWRRADLQAVERVS